MAVPGLVGTMGAISIDKAWSRMGKIAMPDVILRLIQGKACNLAPSGGIEETEIDRFCVRREDGEIYAQTIPRRAERKWSSLLKPIRDRRHQFSCFRRIALRGGR